MILTYFNIVAAAACFVAQLPSLLRSVYYEHWRPSPLRRSIVPRPNFSRASITRSQAIR
jgi:uncharacterized protein (DUF2267 family)